MFLGRKKSRADKVREAVGDFKGKAAEVSKDAASTLAPKMETARDSAVRGASKGYDQASSLVRDEVVPRVRDDYAPRIREAAAPAVAAVLERTPGVEPPKEKKRSRLKRLLVLTGLAGAAAFVYSKVKGSSEPTPAPAPAPRPSPPRPTPVPDTSETATAKSTDTAVDTPVTDPSDPVSEAEAGESATAKKAPAKKATTKKAPSKSTDS